MKVKYLLATLLLALFILVPSLALGADEPVKLGDITAFSGEVLARTKGVWVKVQSAPHPVFSDDKVVTRRGRAEIGFVDGGVMRLNLDSNISIEQVNEEEGFAFKNKVSTRQVNLLVGEMWFSVKVEKGNKLNVSTPTMTAAVRGSAATILQGINPNEPAKYSFIEGDIDTQGDYQPIPPKAINWSDIRTNASDLPPSNPGVDSSEAQRAAVDAVESRSSALQSASRAGEDSEVAQAAGDQAAKSQATEDKLKAANMKAKANKGMGQAAVLDKKAKMIAEQEKMLEAKAFKNVKKIAEVQSTISQLGQEITQLETVTQALEQVAQEVENAVQSGDVQTAEQTLQQSEQLMIEVPAITTMPSGETTTSTTTEAAPTETELGYTEEGTTTTTTTTTEIPPDTQDLGTSSPAY